MHYRSQMHIEKGRDVLMGLQEQGQCSFYMDKRANRTTKL